MFPKYRWRLLRGPAPESTSQDPSLLIRVLRARGIAGAEAVMAFLQHRAPGPLVLPDLEPAVERLRAACKRAETVYIYGDYDVDGVTSTAIMYEALTRLGARVVCRIPDREADGYGLCASAVSEARQAGATLIVAVDCGTSDVEPVMAARSAGIDVVIIDHHMAHSTLPPALAVVNPQRPDHQVSFRHLAAAGVCFLIAQALMGEDAAALVDLAALGTIADVMPLVDINREIAAAGLRAMSERPRPSVAALVESARLKFPLSSRDVAFALAPRLNAAGRMGNASRALDLMLSRTADIAREHALALENENRARQDLERVMLKEALLGVQTAGFPVAIVARPGWRRGLVGLVAGRLCESLGRPAAAISIEGGIGRGSIRSPSDFDVFRALTACSRLLTRYGGHSRAGGFDVMEHDIPALAELLSETSPAYIPGPPELVIDAQAEIGELSLRSVSELGVLEPCGEANPRPVFLLREVEAFSPRRVGGNGQHLKFSIRGPGAGAECIWFGAGSSDLPRGPVDLAVEPSVSEYSGKPGIELMVRDMRISAENRIEHGFAPAHSIEVTAVRETSQGALQRHLSRGGRPYEVWRDSADPFREGPRYARDLIVESPPVDPEGLRRAVREMPAGSRVILNFTGADVQSTVDAMLACAPDRERLAACYRVLSDGIGSVDQYVLQLALRGIVPQAYAMTLAETALAIFAELQIVDLAQGITIRRNAAKVDLNDSPTFRKRQAEIMPVVEFYSRMCHSVGALMDWLIA